MWDSYPHQFFVKNWTKNFYILLFLQPERRIQPKFSFFETVISLRKEMLMDILFSIDQTAQAVGDKAPLARRTTNSVTVNDCAGRFRIGMTDAFSKLTKKDDLERRNADET